MTHLNFIDEELEDSDMLAKKNRTIDEYKKAGAKMRLFKNVGAKLAVDISKVISASDYKILESALHRIDEVCSRAEDNMFSDFPGLGSEYVNVFYGNVGDKPRNPLDEEVLQLAKKASDELFE